MKEVKGFCTLCRSHCGSVGLVDKGRLISVRPDPEHPTGAAMCLKGRSAPEIIAASNRLLYPMIRTTPKGQDPCWKRIGWDEALAICAERLGRIRDESGPEAVSFAITTKSGTGIADSVQWVERLVRTFGSPNIASAISICNWHKDVAHQFTFGTGLPTADYARAGMIVLWGHNPTSTWLAQAEAISQGRKSGAALMVIDPRPIPLAAGADAWLKIRPGTDVYLAIGLIALLMANEAYDAEFVCRWTNAPMLVHPLTGGLLRMKDIDPGAGNHYVVWDKSAGGAASYDTRFELDRDVALHGPFDLKLASGETVSCRTVFDLLAETCSAWPVEKVSRITGVADSLIRQAAQLFSARRPIAYHAWCGIGQSPESTRAERAVAILYALSGSFDVAGGNRVHARHPVARVDGLDLISPLQLKKALGSDRFSMGPEAQGRVRPIEIYRSAISGKPYKIRAMVAFGSNHLASQADAGFIEQGLKALEFHVHCDIVETPTSRYADMVLPINTPWERSSLRVGFEISERAQETIQYRPAFIPSRGESRSDMDIVFDLACRLGLGSYFFNGDQEAAWNYLLAPAGVTVAELKAAGNIIAKPLSHKTQKYGIKQSNGEVPGFDTPSRRVEIYSEQLQKAGYEALPTPTNAPDGAWPLIATSTKSGYFCHSQHRAIPKLRRKAVWPRAIMHPDTAAARGIVQGNWVYIQNEKGRALFQASIDPLIARDVVAADFGYWESGDGLGFPGTYAGDYKASNFNNLVDPCLVDPVSGAVSLKSVPCDLVLATNVGRQAWAGFEPMKVVAVHPESRNAMRVVLQAQCGLVPAYFPGQHIRIRLPGADGVQNNEQTRSYSLIGPALRQQENTFTICVAREAQHSDFPGKVSGYIHDRLRVGDPVDVEAPGGTFTIPTQASRPIVLIATGIGITPFMSYIETLRFLGHAPEVLLLYGNRDGRSHAFKQRLRSLQKALPTLRVINFYSKPSADDIIHRDFDIASRIDVGVIPSAWIEAGLRAYICGSSAVIASIREGLLVRGVQPFDVFYEFFSTPRRAVEAVDHDRECQVHFVRSGRHAVWKPSEGSLLEFSERQGISAPSGCRVGQCESCAARILDGAVDHMNGVEADEPGVALLCQAMPIGKSISIDL